MQSRDIRRDDYEEVLRLQVNPRPDWAGIFSANSHGEIWPHTTRGLTPGMDRVGVRGISGLLDNTADIYLKVRPEGGRIFISEKGCFYKDRTGKIIQFVKFKFSVL